MTIKENAVVTLEFKVYDRASNELLEDTDELGAFNYIQGVGAFVPKVEELLEGKEAGFKGEIELDKEEAYGDYDPELQDEMTRADFSEFDDIYVGMEFVAEMEDDSEMIFTISDIDGDTVIADGNHPFSGRDLRFEVFVKDVREATEEELAHGHVHSHGESCHN